MNDLMLPGAREVYCRNRDCPHLAKSAKPMLLARATRGSQVELKCPGCKQIRVYRIPLTEAR